MSAVTDAFMAPKLWTCPFMTFVVNEADVTQHNAQAITAQAACKGLLCPLWREQKPFRADQPNLGYCGAGGRP